MKNKILILGASGMLGSTLLKYFSSNLMYEVYGTLRFQGSVKSFDQELQNKLIVGVDVEKTEGLLALFNNIRPTIVINCVGIVKQLKEAEDALIAIPINSLLPHILARLCESIGSRLIHFSTDCVFSGLRGMYTEEDFPDCNDLYGRSKYLGESTAFNTITLRTSIIGHELNGNRSLVNWFLSQEDQVTGFKNAVFSGLPTVEVARIIQDFVIPNKSLSGLYHISADPINKFDLLRLVADQYKKEIKIIPDDNYKIDRSLDSSRFKNVTGFKASSWNDMIKIMYQFR
jgi:dTDP-4-dehydrorhamnose reductase